MPRAVMALGGAAICLAALVPVPAQAQDWTRREYPLAPPNSNNNFVAPYFDGWYPNPDGSHTLSFGFMNRNDEDLIEIPLGADNFIEPAEFNGRQPTTFPVVRYPGFGGPRERGVFAVVIPAGYEGDVWWTLTTDGYTTRVPGRITSPGPVIKGAYELSTTPQAEGSLRPIIRFSENGPDGIGLVGIDHPQGFSTKVGQPIEVRFWAFDRGERELKDVNMTLWKHQGPAGGVIAFESLVEPAPSPGRAGGPGGNAGLPPGFDAADLPPDLVGRFGGAGRGATPPPGPVAVGRSVRLPITGPNANVGRFRATFDTPGEYMIRIRVDNFTSGDSSMGNQCCWTNGFVRVNVTQ